MKNNENESNFKFLNIVSLQNKIKKVVCGSNFSVCLDITGRLFSWGSNYYNCLGIPEIDSCRLIEPISETYFGTNIDGGYIKVTDISCGMQHCLALNENGNNLILR